MRSLIIPCFIPFFALITTTANATDSAYCPAAISCQVNASGLTHTCNGMPDGWRVTVNTSNGVQFLEGEYVFNFSAAQSYPNAASNCNYVTKSKDTTATLIVTLSNDSWKAAAPGLNQWKTSGQATYCYAPGLWYDKINDASACPFVAA
jgi:hypothetical protein